MAGHSHSQVPASTCGSHQDRQCTHSRRLRGHTGRGCPVHTAPPHHTCSHTQSPRQGPHLPAHVGPLPSSRAPLHPQSFFPPPGRTSPRPHIDTQGPAVPTPTPSHPFPSSLLRRGVFPGDSLPTSSLPTTLGSFCLRRGIRGSFMLMRLKRPHRRCGAFFLPSESSLRGRGLSEGAGPCLCQRGGASPWEPTHREGGA